MYWTFTRAFVKEKPFIKRREINAPLAPVRTTLGKVTGEDVEKRDPSGTAGGNANWCSLWGNQYGAASKIKRRSTIQPGNSTSVSLSKENKTLIKNKQTKKQMCPYLFIATLFTVAQI